MSVGDETMTQTEWTFNQLQLRFTDPIQYDYEAIRPIMLFAQPISERSEETEVARSTLAQN